MGRLNDLLIRTDIRAMELRDRAFCILSGDEGVETGEIVVALAIFVIVGGFIAKLFGTSFMEKATEVINGVKGTTWTP